MPKTLSVRYCGVDLIDVHKLVTDGLRVNPDLRWGTLVDDAGAYVIQVSNVETSDRFTIELKRTNV
jgi:hypothetical protein